MFITCQECNTTFRLDERLLKPTGSKVRCSQCHYKFIAMPPRPKQTAPSQAPQVMNESMTKLAEPPAINAQPEENVLEGIDLMELDSLLVGAQVDAPKPEKIEEQKAEPAALDEVELDFDFDAVLDTHTAQAKAELTVGETVGAKEPEEMDLGLDFEIDDVTLSSAKEIEKSVAALEVEENKPLVAKEISTEPSFGDDLELALEGLELEPHEEIDQAVKLPADKAEKKEDLDFGDFDLDLEAPGPKKVAAGEEPVLSLDEDLDLGLSEPAPVAAVGTDAGSVKPKDDLGLDLEDEFSVPESGAQEEALNLGGDLDLDDEFDLEMESAPATSAGGKKGKGPASAPKDELSIDDLDLTDLDTLMGTGDEEGAGASEALRENDLPLNDLDLDLDFDLDLDEEKQKETKPAPEKSLEEELEDLDFELDTEFEDKPAAELVQKVKAPDKSSENILVQDAISSEDEIDLSDIEQMLGGEAQAPQKTAPAVIAQEDLGLGGESEIDLAEIETAIDAADTMAGVDSDELEEQELELDSSFEKSISAIETPADLPLELSMESKTTKTEEGDLDLELELETETQASAGQTVDLDKNELDLSDLSDLVEEQTHVAKRETVTSGDIELEFQIEEDTGPAKVSTTAGIGRTAGRAAEPTFEQSMESTAAQESIASRPKPFKPKKKSGKLLVFLFFLILIGAIGYAVYYAVMQMGIEIPYVSDYLKPKAKDPSGIINLSTLDINSKFIDNSQSGRLFIITGKVRNGYGTQRNNIRLQGRLFTKGKVLVKTEFSYAGIMIDDQDLAVLPIAEIKQRLNAVPQPQEAMGSARPGQNVAFMVVFSELPPADQLDEFAVEMVSSTPAP